MNKIGRFLVLFSFLVFGLISCEKEALDGEITIRFALGDGAYGTDETRGTKLEERDLEPETVVVPVEGVLHMYATLEEEPTLRAAGSEVMEIGTKIVIAAYDEDGDYVDKAEYEVTDGSGGIKPTDGSGRGLTITTEGDYTFVAYSLNTTSSFTYSDDMGPYSANDPNHDPLWGASPKVTVSAGMNRVNIEMRHVFSKVKIRALSTELSGTPAISNVSATLVGYKAVIQDGAIGKGVAEDQVFVAFPASPTTDALSAPRVVYAGGEDITTIKINSATIGTTTHTGSVARFNKKLLPGRSYTLTVKFDELVWAASNVYWETVASGDKAPGYLTFDKVITETPYNQGYQGVFFKWGSLVGISPAQGSGSNDTEKNAYSTSTPVYIPNYNAGSPLASTWSKPTTSSYGSWSSTNDQSTALATDIPYMDANYTSSDYSRNSTFVIDAERNRPEDYAKKVGDICQYIGKTGAGPTDYRLPTSSEMGTTLTDSPGFTPSTPVSGGWVRGPGNFTYTMSAGTPDGKTDLIKTKGLGSAVNSAMGVVLPGSGYRTSNGVLNRVGGGGDYWNGSAGSATTGGRFIFLYDGINPDGPAARSYGFSVRCVRN